LFTILAKPDFGESKKWQANDKKCGVPFGLRNYLFLSMKDVVMFAKAESNCVHPLCPLNRVKAGVAVRIKQLCATPELSDRLREIGFCEDAIVKLVTNHSNIICLVCNTRLALSEQVAQRIMVEPVLDRLAG
jgi:ferrous iron transport protein A